MQSIPRSRCVVFAVVAGVVGYQVGGRHEKWRTGEKLAEAPQQQQALWPKWNSNWDGKANSVVQTNNDNKSAETTTTTATTAKIGSRNIILIRHGQYETASKNDLDRVLTAVGREQARLTGLKLKEMNLPIKMIHVSTMTRAKETAEIIAQQLGGNIPLHQTDLIREGIPVLPDPCAPSKVESYTRSAQKHNQRMEDFYSTFFQRPDASQTEDSWEVVVCHGNVIRYYVLSLLQLPKNAWLRTCVRNCSISWLILRPTGSVSCYAFGDAGHLPWALSTTN